MENELIQIEVMANAIPGNRNCMVNLTRVMVPELNNIPKYMNHICKTSPLCWCLSVIASEKHITRVYGNTIDECISLTRKELMNIIEGK